VGRFPVTFLSALDEAPFRITAYFILFYLVMPQLSGSMEIYVKYLFALSLLLGFVLVALTGAINLSSPFLVAPLTLAAIGGISLSYSTLVAPEMSTYSSALIPLVVTAIPLFIRNSATRTHSRVVAEYLFRIFGLASVCHLLWQAVSGFLGWEELVTYYGWVRAPSHDGTIAFVYLMLLSSLFRRNLMFCLSVGLIVLSLALRPTSTLVFASFFASMAVILHRLRLRRILRFFCMILVLAIIVENLSILESEKFADAVFSVEPLVKQEALGGPDNNDFRLGVLAAARDEMAGESFLIGKAFIGNVAVDALVRLPWVHDETMLSIHSDFVIMIVQGGLIGYGLFAVLFIGMARLCGKGARLAHAGGDFASETLFDVLQAMNVTAMLYMSQEPMMQLTNITLPYLILIPLAIFLARSQPGFSVAGRRRSAGRLRWAGGVLRIHLPAELRMYGDR
jgi:hypothetical protein